jgi:hypothetical protein
MMRRRKLALAKVGAALALGLAAGAAHAAGFVKISTLVANNSASFAWTGLSRYNSLQMTCSGISLPTTDANNYMVVHFGEGPGPTWETANADYSWAYILNFDKSGSSIGTDTSLSEASDGTDGGILVLHEPIIVAAGQPYGTLHLKVLNVDSGAMTKAFFWQSQSYFDKFEDQYNINLTGEGAYVGDTSPITAIRLVPHDETISSGTCTLYGWQ